MVNYPALFLYDCEMNTAIVKHAIDSEVESEKFTKIASHIYGAGQTWLFRLQGSKGTAPQVWPEYSLLTLLPALDALHQNIENFLHSSGFDDQQTISYTNSAGKKFTNSTTEILTHLLLHNSYHRGQLNMLLRQEGKQPVKQDFIFFARINDINF